MKIVRLIAILGLIAISGTSYSQVAINTTGAAPVASAMLDITSTSSGLLIPRMTTGERNLISTPVGGLLVYDNTLNTFYRHNGTSWGALSTQWTTIGSDIYYSSGNVGIGTTSPVAKLDITKNSTYNSESTAGLKITDGGSNVGILLGTDVTNTVSYIQSMNPGTSYSAIPLSLNPNGGNVGIRTTSPNSTLHVNGSFSTAFVAKSSSYTATASDRIISITSSGKTIFLPTAVGITGRQYTIKLNVGGTATGTVSTTGGQFIDASPITSYPLTENKYVTVVSNGTKWLVIGNN